MICVILPTRKRTERQFEVNSKQHSADWYRFSANFNEPYRGMNDRQKFCCYRLISFSRKKMKNAFVCHLLLLK